VPSNNTARGGRPHKFSRGTRLPPPPPRRPTPAPPPPPITLAWRTQTARPDDDRGLRVKLYLQEGTKDYQLARVSQPNAAKRERANTSIHVYPRAPRLLPPLSPLPPQPLPPPSTVAPRSIR